MILLLFCFCLFWTDDFGARNTLGTVRRRYPLFPLVGLAPMPRMGVKGRGRRRRRRVGSAVHRRRRWSYLAVPSWFGARCTYHGTSRPTRTYVHTWCVVRTRAGARNRSMLSVMSRLPVHMPENLFVVASCAPLAKVANRIESENRIEPNHRCQQGQDDLQSKEPFSD